MSVVHLPRRVQVAVLASGSSGNCTYVGDGRAGVLIDCGISALQVLRRMDELGLGEAPIDAVLVTHEHSDHVAAARVLENRLRKRLGRHVPFLMTRGTCDGLREGQIPEAIERVEAGVAVELAHLRLEPVPVPHDTAEPIAWLVQAGGVRVGVITDLGRPTTLIQEALRGLDIAVLEFNHDPGMLLEGSYPWPLKQRIRGGHGHLSNDQARELLREGLGTSLRHLVLGHLSEENNTPALALAAAAEALRDRGALGRVELSVGLGRRALPPVSVDARD